METFNYAVWSVIVGLALMLVGGLVLWAYGARLDRRIAFSLTVSGPEAEATRLFHTKLVRWFHHYGISVIAVGFVFLLMGALSL